MPLPRLIAIAGKKGCGKTLSANYLSVRYGYTVINFADSLKNLVCKLLRVSRDELEKVKDMHYGIQLGHADFNTVAEYTGIHLDHVYRVLGNGDFNGPRQMLQIIGTDLIRSFDSAWHVRQLAGALDDDKTYCIPDLRFNDELEFLLGLGCKTLLINRTRCGGDSHISENSLGHVQFDYVVRNDNDIDALVKNLDVFISRC